MQIMRRYIWMTCVIGVHNETKKKSFFKVESFRKKTEMQECDN